MAGDDRLQADPGSTLGTLGARHTRKASGCSKTWMCCRNIGDNPVQWQRSSGIQLANHRQTGGQSRHTVQLLTRSWQRVQKFLLYLTNCASLSVNDDSSIGQVWEIRRQQLATVTGYRGSLHAPTAGGGHPGGLECPKPARRDQLDGWWPITFGCATPVQGKIWDGFVMHSAFYPLLILLPLSGTHSTSVLRDRLANYYTRMYRDSDMLPTCCRQSAATFRPPCVLVMAH